MIGHPERSLPRFVRQTESKDLHLFCNELQTHQTRWMALPTVNPAPRQVPVLPPDAHSRINSQKPSKNLVAADLSGFLRVTARPKLNVYP